MTALFSSCQSQVPSFSVSPTEPDLEREPNHTKLLSNSGVDPLWNEVVNALPYGIIVMTPEGQLVYANTEAQALCPHLTHSDSELSTLSQFLEEIRDRWSHATLLRVEQLVMECWGRQQRIRVKIQPLVSFPQNQDTDSRTDLILVMLENCDEKFREERWIECQKYGLTKREAEVWTLLKQGDRYQDIANHLQLSLNTIKTHVKRIHDKQHRYDSQGKPSVWFSCSSR